VINTSDNFTGSKIVNPVKDVKFSAKIKGDEEKPEPKKKEPAKKAEEPKKEEPKKTVKEILEPETTPVPERKEKIDLDEIFERHKKLRLP